MQPDESKSLKQMSGQARGKGRRARGEGPGAGAGAKGPSRGYGQEAGGPGASGQAHGARGKSSQVKGGRDCRRVRTEMRVVRTRGRISSTRIVFRHHLLVPKLPCARAPALRRPAVHLGRRGVAQTGLLVAHLRRVGRIRLDEVVGHQVKVITATAYCLLLTDYSLPGLAAPHLTAGDRYT